MSTITRTMNDLISVIIPAYNAETRIKYTLESIIKQDYEELEIILVDDVSTDNTASAAREVLSSSSRKFTVITHERNRGECASRNTGIEHAKGKYICFVDADDMLEENFVSSLHGIIAGNDIVFCGLIDRFTDGRPNILKPKAQGMSSPSCGEDFILSGNIPPVWCCLYDAGFLKGCGLLFHEGCTAGGDVEFMTKALCRAETAAFTEQCLYIYIHHENMGSVRDNDTGMKKTLRYEHNTYAQKRTAEYLMQYAKSQHLKDLAGNILLPQSVLRLFTLHAMKQDRAGYDSLRRDGNIAAVLSGTQNFHVLMNKPELFLKAFAVLHAPSLYYRLRS